MLVTMESMSPPHEAIRAQVQKMVTSATFSGAQRAIRLLPWLVEQTLAGRAATLKEYTLGADGLGRGAKFDPRTDATARVEASRLRTRIDLYYAKEGVADPIRISLPKGSYVPVFAAHASPARQTRERTRPGWLIPLLACVAALAVAAGWYAWRPGAVAARSLAVLPFDTEPASEYMADGLTENLINNLASLSALRVTARSVAFSLKGKHIPPQEVGKQLNVETVLTGRVSVQDQALTVQVDLVDTATGAQKWGERYERKVTDLMAVQDDIGRQVTQHLGLRLTGSERSGLSKRYTNSGEAYRLYLQGLYYSSKPSQPGVLKAIDYYNRALEVDPRFAPAYVKLATTYILQSADGGSDQYMRRAKAAAQKAIEIDPELAEARAEYGFIKWVYDLDYAGAERELRLALELNPNSAEAHYDYARVLAENGRFDEAMAEAERGIELDPLSMQIRKRLPYVLYLARRYDEAIAEYQKLIELAPDFIQTQREIGLAYEQTARYDQALQQFTRVRAMPENYATTMLKADVAHVYALMDRRPEAEQLLEELVEQSKRSYISAYDIALVYAGLKNTDEALAWLTKALEQRPFFIGWINVDPRLDSVRSDVRFQEILSRAGLARPAAAEGWP